MDFSELELSLLVTYGSLVGSSPERLGDVERLIWVKASRRDGVARGLTLARTRWSDAPGLVTSFEPGSDEVARLADLLEQAGLPDRLPQIQHDLASTSDLWTQVLLRLKIDCRPQACCELNYVALEPGEDLARLRAALQFLYRLAGCPDAVCERVL